ncbi:MAG TPA: bifunctional oligoribonuclease/PAP phosphatase NrnA [Candidatus Limnocylindria bacterium]|nr:bifunctional oligoribonuclease/PAP phosphatase NrnA [Candidatus Limnocylindria bacterium]
MSTRIDLAQALDTLGSARRVLLCTHVQPDGDAIGSLLAAGEWLRGIGKEVLTVCHDPVPQNLLSLPGWETVRKPHEAEGRQFDLGLSVDASDLARIGDAGRYFSACPVTMVIDHHTSNTLFGQHNYVDSLVAATGNLIIRLAEASGANITRTMAECLYAALSTDTGNFAFGQMDEEFFAQMSRLMRAGLDISAAARALHLTKAPEDVMLLGRALASLAFLKGGRLTRMVLRAEDFRQAGATPENADRIVNHGLNIRGVEVAFLATQEEAGVKVSLRALPPHDVSKVALELGGGGHMLAAGCTLRMPMDEALALVESRLSALLS